MSNVNSDSWHEAAAGKGEHDSDDAAHAGPANATTPLPRLDRRAAKRFLDALCGGDSSREPFGYQTFDDVKSRKNWALIRTWTGSFTPQSAAELEQLNKQGAGVFVTVNRVDGRGRQAQNATAVRALFVDLDGAPLEPVRNWSLKPYIIVESSPDRFHVYWRHDGSVELKDFTRLQLKLATLFTGDPVVADLTRVMRLPGAWHQKHDPFQTRIVSVDDSAPAYSLPHFERELADVEVPQHKQGKPKREPKPRERCSAREWVNQKALHRIDDWAPKFFSGGSFSAQGAWRVPSSELGRQCEEDLAIHPDGITDFGTQWPDHPADGYTAIRLLMAFFNETSGDLDLVTEFDEHGSPQGGSLTHERAAEVLAEAMGFDWSELLKEDEERARSGLDEVEIDDERPPPAFADDALALLFAEQHSGRLRYCAAWSKWLWWDCNRWNTDDTVLAYDFARKVCRKAATEANEPAVQKKICSANTIAAVERLARADRRLAATIVQWDAEAWLLNTPGGIIDLRSGEIRPPQPTDYMTKITAVAPNGACPLWRKFLNRIFAGDAELIAFVQRVAGYTLTGSTREHAMFFGFGTGANGKSVLINTISGILGDYHRTAAIETFTASKFDRHPTDLAGLRGARLVTAIETEGSLGSSSAIFLATPL